MDYFALKMETDVLLTLSGMSGPRVALGAQRDAGCWGRQSQGSGMVLVCTRVGAVAHSALPRALKALQALPTPLSSERTRCVLQSHFQPEKKACLRPRKLTCRLPQPWEPKLERITHPLFPHEFHRLEGHPDSVAPNHSCSPETRPRPRPR